MLTFLNTTTTTTATTTINPPSSALSATPLSVCESFLKMGFSEEKM